MDYFVSFVFWPVIKEVFANVYQNKICHDCHPKAQVCGAKPRPMT